MGYVHYDIALTKDFLKNENNLHSHLPAQEI
jgi:hypothetical protein